MDSRPGSVLGAKVASQFAAQAKVVSEHVEQGLPARNVYVVGSVDDEFAGDVNSDDVRLDDGKRSVDWSMNCPHGGLEVHGTFRDAWCGDELTC